MNFYERMKIDEIIREGKSYDEIISPEKNQEKVKEEDFENEEFY